MDEQPFLLRAGGVEPADVLAGGTAVCSEGVDALRGHEVVIGLQPQTAQSADAKDRLQHVVVDELLSFANDDDFRRCAGVVRADGQQVRGDLDVLRVRRIENAHVGVEDPRAAADAQVRILGEERQRERDNGTKDGEAKTHGKILP